MKLRKKNIHPVDQLELGIGSPERQRIINFPNELTDGKPGSFCQSELFQFIRDETCNGLYCQKYPEHWLVRLLTEIDRRDDRREAVKLVLNLMSEEQCRVGGQSQLQIEMNLRRHRNHHGHLINWGENRYDQRCHELAQMFWWRDLPELTIQSLAAEDAYAAHELATHQWD